MAGKLPLENWKEQKGGDSGDRIRTYLAKLNNSNPRKPKFQQLQY